MIHLVQEFESEKSINYKKTILKILGLECPTSKAVYKNTNQLVEKISDIPSAILVKVMPQCVIGPKFVISFAKYFATDLNNGAFELPLTWW